MHILYHHRTAGDRVEGVHIMGMVKAMRELGHTVEISSPPGCAPERNGAVPAGRGDGRLRRLLKRTARKAPPLAFELGEIAYNGCSWLDMMRRAAGRRPDLIYERTTSNSLAPTCLARQWGVPIVQEVNVTADLGRFRPLVLGDFTRRAERWVARNAAALVTVSREFSRRLVELGFPAERVLVCQNAIDPRQFDPDAVRPASRPAHVGPGAVVVGYVGSFLPYHRLEMLVEAAAALRQDRGALRWLLVGDGVERPRIEALIRERRLGELFWMPGRVEHAEVPRFVGAMDVAVLPSCASFNSPVKLFEYMAMAKPVVVPATPAIEEVIEHGRTGMLFDTDHYASFAAVVQRLAGDTGLRSHLGRAARRRVLQEHTWRRNAERVLDFVQEIKQASGGTSSG
ncbi:MAG: glycosyltransferase family 4 protein [Candidatus Brocadiia bacterium]